MGIYPNNFLRLVRQAVRQESAKFLFVGSNPTLVSKFMSDQQKRIKHEEEYIAFLEKRLKSENFKKNVSKEEYTKTQEKLKKARLVLKILNA